MNNPSLCHMTWGDLSEGTSLDGYPERPWATPPEAFKKHYKDLAAEGDKSFIIWPSGYGLTFITDDGCGQVSGRVIRRSPKPQTERRVASARLRFLVFQRDKFTCVYCGRRSPDVILHCDHILAFSIGGKTKIDNLVTACSQCNGGKSNLIMESNEAISLIQRS